MTNLYLLNNPINEIDLNGFNNTNFKEIRLSIPNITIEMIRVLNNSLKPNFAYKNWIYDYYDSIYIENRQDIDCFKMLFLIEFKIFYNFINDNVDVNDIITNCMNLTKVRDTLNKFKGNLFHLNYKPKVIPTINRVTYKIIIWSLISTIMIGLFIHFIYIMSRNNNKNKINDFSSNKDEDNNNVESFLETKLEQNNNLVMKQEFQIISNAENNFEII